MYKIINSIKLIGIIGIFSWISFFAPLVAEKGQYLFFCILAILLLILLILDKNSYKLVFNKAEIPFCIFLLTMAGGIAAVKDPAVAYRHFWFFIFPVPFLFFFAKAAFQEKYGLLIIRSICFMASIVCIYGIIEIITKQNFIYGDYVNNIYYKVFAGRRMISTQIHPAPLGTYLIAIFPLACGLLLKERNLFLKSLAILYSAVIFISIFFTFSRGTFFGTFVAMAIMAAFLTKQKKIFFLSALISVIAIIGISSLLFYLGRIGFFRYSLQGLQASYVYSRKIDRFIALGQILKDHPFLGLGFGHYRVLFDHYLPHLANVCNYDGKVADCMYITLLAETGIIGFLGFMFFVFFLLKRAWASLKSALGYENRLILLSFLSGFAGMMCTFLTYDGLYWSAPGYLFWAYAGILSYLGMPKTVKNKRIE